jgi:hypothetical protein
LPSDTTFLFNLVLPLHYNKGQAQLSYSPGRSGLEGAKRAIFPARIFWKKGKKRFKNFLKQCIIKLPLKNGEAGRVFSA